MGLKIADLLEVLFQMLSGIILLYKVNNLYLIWSAGKYENTASDVLIEFPKGSVQLPIYNEKEVVSRLIDAISDIRWPRESERASVSRARQRSTFNDFTDALIFTGYIEEFYAPGCWARTTQDHNQGETLVNVPDDELWYSSPTTGDDIGYAIVSTYKDLNETVGFLVYGYTAEDTYYTCYALRGGLLPWLQQLQCGTTTIILEIDYRDIPPVGFHVKECLGHNNRVHGIRDQLQGRMLQLQQEPRRDERPESESMSLGYATN